MTAFDPETVSICVNCGKRLWRKDRHMTVVGRNGDGTMTVCPHCLEPFELIAGKWQPLPLQKLLGAWHILEPVALDYMRQNKLAAAEGLTLEEWQAKQPQPEHMRTVGSA